MIDAPQEAPQKAPCTVDSTDNDARIRGIYIICLTREFTEFILFVGRTYFYEKALVNRSVSQSQITMFIMLMDGSIYVFKDSDVSSNISP